MMPQRAHLLVPSVTPSDARCLRPIPLGLAGGILNTLMLAADRLASTGSPLSLAECLPIVMSALTWNLFAVLVMRKGLVDASLAGISGFIGAWLPILLAWMMPSHQALVLGIAVLTSSSMGIPLAKGMQDSVVRWVLWLMLAGCMTSALGGWLPPSEYGTGAPAHPVAPD